MAQCACGRDQEANKSRCFWCIRYGALGLKVGASEAEIKAAHRATINKYHPDKWVTAGKTQQAYANKRTQQANDAFRELKGTQVPPVPPPYVPPEPEPEPQAEPVWEPEVKTETARTWEYTKSWEYEVRPEPPAPAPQPEPVRETPVQRWERTTGRKFDPEPAKGLDHWYPDHPHWRWNLRTWFQSARPWILAILLFAAPPLIILARRSSFPFELTFIGLFAASAALYLLVGLLVRVSRIPAVRTVGPFLALFCASWLLWTRTPLGRLLYPTPVAKAPRVVRQKPPVIARSRTPGNRTRAEKGKPSAAKDHPTSPPANSDDGEQLVRNVVRDDGTVVPIIRRKPQQP